MRKNVMKINIKKKKKIFLMIKKDMGNIEMNKIKIRSFIINKRII